MKGRPAEAEIQGYFCPLQRADLVAKRLASGLCTRTELGLEKRCSKCLCFWPMDTEYWFPSKTPDGLFPWCRACYIGQRWPERGAPERAIASPALTQLLRAIAPSSASEARA
jgi:hypothetical protein